MSEEIIKAQEDRTNCDVATVFSELRSAVKARDEAQAKLATCLDDVGMLTARIADLVLDQQRHELLKARVTVAEVALNEDFKSGPFEPDQSFQDRVRVLVDYANRMSDRLRQIGMNVRDDADEAIRDIAAERRRQVDEEGFTAEGDDQATEGQLAKAASCYARYAGWMVGALLAPKEWPWSADWWKPTNRRRDLVKAGALIAAEIARLDRQSAKEAEAAEAPAEHLAAFKPGWWRPWGGGGCPKDAVGKKVDVLFRDGSTVFGTAAVGGPWTTQGSWLNQNRPDDIVAYRVRQEQE